MRSHFWARFFCVSFGQFHLRFQSLFITLLNKPENILVSYELVGDKVIDFKMVVADWGSAKIGDGGERFLGGTPVYAGPKTFDDTYKDLFSFGRMAMELFMDKSGTESKPKINEY